MPPYSTETLKTQSINPVSGVMADMLKDCETLEQLFGSEQWDEYFHGFSSLLNIEFSIYDEDMSLLYNANKDPFCTFIKSSKMEETGCDGSCTTGVDTSKHQGWPVVKKCGAGLMNFSFPVKGMDEKAFFVGVGGFAGYEDFLEYTGIVKRNDLAAIPALRPLSFPGKDYIGSVSRYSYTTVSTLFKSFDEKFRTDEKLLRMTSLFDSQAFGTLSKNPELLYRYIMDTLDFVFGNMSFALFVSAPGASGFKAACSSGKYRDALIDLTLDSGSSLINDLDNNRAPVFRSEMEELSQGTLLKDVDTALFIPVVINGKIDLIMGVFDRKFSRKDMKILNAFKDYIQLNLENSYLRMEINKKRKANKYFSSFMDFSSSISSVLDLEKLLSGLLLKTIQLLNAEQGSLMLLDEDTSELVIEAKRSGDDIVQEQMRIKRDEGIAGLVLEKGALLVEDIEKDPRILKANRPRYKTKSFISVPIRIEERLSGVINVSDKVDGHAFNEDDLMLVESLMSNIAIAIERSLLYKKTEELRKLSITDPLTGMYNRRYLNLRLSEEITRYNRYKHPFSFMMLDLDKFKYYNDTYGHMAGDDLIKDLGVVIERSLRTIDIAARFGGDEFVAIFPQTPKDDAIQITNRLKEKIDAELCCLSDEISLSVSMGLATFPDDASSIMELLEKTDQALYLAKKGGGNTVVYL